ncbi:MAG: hypothetical protein A2511_03500 [Deltaproteobacteria bacterium RIFOXYD12_FULL_50_9]|nr:MAG: hypothetical protein A2511_03500 [Deltaproteobacteria bacterium RIFOXYD12_FULL_50_9]
MSSETGTGFRKIGISLLLVGLICFVFGLTACRARSSRTAVDGGRSTNTGQSISTGDSLLRDLDNTNANIRLKAVRSLGSTGPKANSAVSRLLEMAGNDPHPNVRSEALVALAKIDPENLSVVGLAIAAISDSNIRVRKEAIVDLARAGYTNGQFLAALQKKAQFEPDRRLRKVADGAYRKLLAQSAVAGRSPEVKPPADKQPVKEAKAALEKPAPKADEEFKPTVEFVFPKARDENRDAVAVIIGNKDYEESEKNVPDVKFAHNDAEAMNRFVIESLGYREGNVLLILDATQADLVATFGTKDDYKGRLFDWIRPGKSDVFVYYSGHGAPSLHDGSSFLLPVDADPMKVELTGYKLETFYDNLNKINARKVTIVLDACFSGSSSEGVIVKNASSISLRVVDPKKLASATIFTASDSSEVASWDDKAKYGLFTRHFLEGVTGKADGKGFGDGDGKVELSEMKTFLESEVTYDARRQYGRDQHPRISGDQKEVISVVK